MTQESHTSQRPLLLREDCKRAGVLSESAAGARMGGGWGGLAVHAAKPGGVRGAAPGEGEQREAEEAFGRGVEPFGAER